MGDDEQARGEVRIKELGLEAGHAEKDGVLVPLTDLVPEVRRRLARRLERKDDDSGRREGVDAVNTGLDGLGLAEEDAKGKKVIY